ncbi:MAG: hypothetical protein AAFN27_23015 [Pseudomonadota bacterium]
MAPDPNDLDLSILPPEHRAAFEAMQRRVDVLSEANKRQEALIKELRQALHGNKSEKLTEDERQLAFEGEPWIAAIGPRPMVNTITIEEIEAASEEARAMPTASRTRRAPVNRSCQRGRHRFETRWRRQST